MADARVAVLCVCMGNICRSPTAEAILRNKLENNNLSDLVKVDSCGTHGYHVGKAPDQRAIAAAGARGFDLTALRARQVVADDFLQFDYVLAMDADNLAELEQVAPEGSAATVTRLTDFSARYRGADVPDPYYGGAAGFEHVLDMLEDACDGLLDVLRHRLAR